MTPSDLVQKLQEHFDGGDWERAREIWTVETQSLELEDICWVWHQLDSKERAFLKGEDRKYLEEYREQSRV